MAQSHAGGGSIQQTLQQNVDAEPVPLKRKKRDSGAPAGKSVVVLKSSNVTIRNDSVFMPNTIEMAQLKKKEKGQFLTNVQISSKMTQQDIKELLISLFPYLGDQRFYCASAVDNRTRLDFHGERRIWDGGLIKQKIKGNSALYIYTDEGSLGKQDSTSSKQSALKRPHDQMTPTMQGECRIDKGGDVSIMTQGGILAQSGMTQNIVSTASQSQSRKPTMHIVDGQAIPSKSSLLPHTNLQGMVSSSLTRRLNSLNITSAASEQERGQLGQTAAGGYDLTQGGITCNSTAQSKPGSVVSADIDQCAGKRGSVSNAAGAHQEEAGTSESDFESPSSDSALERPSDSGIEGSDNLFVDDKSSGTGFEPVSTGISVPGNLENTLCVEILEPDDKKDLPSDGGPSTASMVNDTSMLDSASEEISFSEELAYIPDVGTSVFGGVQDIFPPCGSVKGGYEFRISLNEALPDKFKSGLAWFDKVAIVPLYKLNPFTLYGTVPRSEVTGDVLVGVLTDSFQELGNTLFKYIDDGENTLKQFIQDPALQAKYFTMLAGNLANGIPTFGSHFAQALGPMNVLQNGSSIQAKQEQSVELLQLMVYTAAQTGAQRFIEMVFSTSAGQVVFNSYKERNSLLEDVARANGHEELAQYLQDVHTRLSLDKNVHSTVIDWLELVEAVKKQSLTTQDESPVGLDQSDEDDDDSSDYFADAETSSCGSCDDDPGWPEISEKKESSTGDIKSTDVDDSEMEKIAVKTSDSNNDRILTGEELNQVPTAKPDGISMNTEAHIKKEEEDASAAEEDFIFDIKWERLSAEKERIRCPFSTKGGSTAFSAINTPTALHETEESPAKRDHVKRGAYKEGPTVGPWFELGWFHSAIVLILVLLIINVVILIFPGTTMLSAATSTTNSPSQRRWNYTSFLPCFECQPSASVKNTCAKKQETDCLECWLGHDYSNTTVTKCCMARSGSADGIYIELSAHDRLCTRQWSTKILSVQSAAVLTVNTSSGTCPYEKKESPGEPSLSQKDASYKKPIQQLSGFFLGVLAALVTTVVAVQWYKKRKRLYQSNDNDAQQSESNNRATTEQQSIPELQHTLIRDHLASRLDDKDPDGTFLIDLIASRLDDMDRDGFYNWKKFADALGLERDELRVNPTDKLNLLSAFAERKDSTIRKLIEASQEAGLPLLASELDKRFLKGS